MNHALIPSLSLLSQKSNQPESQQETVAAILVGKKLLLPSHEIQGIFRSGMQILWVKPYNLFNKKINKPSTGSSYPIENLLLST